LHSLTVAARNGAARVSKRPYPQTVMTVCLALPPGEESKLRDCASHLVDGLVSVITAANRE
jgi:hypothetical protein